MQSRMRWAALFACGLVLAGCEKKTPRSVQVSEAVVNYLSQPGWAGERFEKQILGESCKFRLYDLDEGQIYIRVDSEHPEQAIKHFVKDPKLVEWPQLSEDKTEMRLGRLVMPAGNPLFRMPASNFTVSADKVLTFPYQRATLSLSVSELVDSMDDKWSYGGEYHAVSQRFSARSVEVFINHAPNVQKRGEPVLNRFVQEILKGVSGGRTASREERIQALLDFATDEIEYDPEQKELSFQKLERPIETLMRGKTNCANGAVLFASLLEQDGDDYLLCYFPKHLSVAVEQGKFPNLNGYSFRYRDRTWVMAEPTCHDGFKIGVTILTTPIDVERMEYIQRPSELNVIYNTKTGKQVELLE